MTELGLEAVTQLQNIDYKKGDAETWHYEADEIICGLLTQLGYSEVVKEWNEVPKWYA